MANKDKPICFLDIDDTWLCFNSNFLEQHKFQIINEGIDTFAAPHAREFLETLDKHFEIIWLTAWAPLGKLSQPWKLANATGLPISFFTSKQALPWWKHNDNKASAIPENLTRPWIWIEDDLPEGELQVLNELGMLDRWIRVNVTENVNALCEFLDNFDVEKLCAF
jgi:hypothetical protein